MPDKPEDLLTLGAQVNGLQGPGVKPWHIKATYQDFEFGDSGTFEEFWYSDKKYKRTFTEKEFSQTDFGTSQGVFRLGDQNWPGVVEMIVRNALVEPIATGSDLAPYHLKITTQSVNHQRFVCATEGISPDDDPSHLLQGAVITRSFCFESQRPELRYEALAFGPDFMLFNNVALFQQHCIARDIELKNTSGNQLKIHVDLIESLPPDDSDFTVPAGAKLLSSSPLFVGFSWMGRFLMRTTYAPYTKEYLTKEHSIVSMTIGKDGFVKEAHGISGPTELQQAWSKVVLNWQFRPFLFLGEPVEVETTVSH